MGFSLSIKQKAMNASARHCCVCHKYKGVKLEVHHLIQEVDGGQNTYDNAIPLCFDCHSDAGHYNDRHPKGTKFSKPELKNARDEWYQFVSKNTIVEKIIISDKIHTGYYVIHSFDILDSTFKDDFSSISNSRSRVYLKKNSISEKWEALLKSHFKDFNYNIEQRLLIEIRHFDSIKEYCNTYEEVMVTDKSSAEYPCYEVTRKTDWADLLSIIKPNSFIEQLSNSGIDAEHFCTAVLYKNGEGCDLGNPDVEYTEYLELAPISYVFLGITNASKDVIKLNKLFTREGNKINLPNFRLLPHEMVLIPIATAIDIKELDRNSIVLEHFDDERSQDFTRILNGQGLGDRNVIFFKDRIFPFSITYNDNFGEFEVEIHELDFNNLYSINTYWQCGSCPHLFFKKVNSKQQYVRELLGASSMKKGIDEIVIPENVYEIIIRELEDEITYLDKIRINNKIVLQNIVLEKGNSLTFKVSPFDIINIEGSYEPFYPTLPKINDIWRRNEIIKESNKIFNRT